MIIDLHFHTKQYSPCSKIDFEQGIIRAKELGLDGICITDHDIFASKTTAKELQDKYGILVIVGVEILTEEGDLICFGLDELPERTLSAQELINRVEKLGGACIAAHPFRQNNRGMGEHLHRLTGLHAVETLNGNTDMDNNNRAAQIARKLGIPCTGGSDAHSVNRIGSYATRFFTKIKDEKDLITAIREGKIEPVKCDDLLMKQAQ